MGTENTESTVAAGESTPTPAEPVEKVAESTESTQQPDLSGDAWADWGKDAKDDEPEAKTEELAAKTDDKSPAKPEAKTDATKDEKPLEDQVIEEAFGEKPEEKADDDKTPGSKETELDKQDPKEMIAAQRNATAKAWAERAERIYKPVVDFKYGNLDAKALKETFNTFLGEEKASEYAQFEAHSLVDTNPDAAFHRIYAVKMLAKDPNWQYDPEKVPSLDELLGAKPAETSAASNGNNSPMTSAEVVEITKDLDSELDFDWRNPENDDQFVDDRERMMAKTIRAIEAKALAATKEKDALTEKLSGLEKKVDKLDTDGKTEYQKAVKVDLDKGINDFKSSIEAKVIPIILKNTGLEISKDDTPEVVAFKTRQAELYTGDDHQKKQGSPSRFETFAYEESSVQADLVQVAKDVVNTELQLVLARRAENSADIAKYERELEEFRIPTIQLLGVANKEFKAKYVDPVIALLGLKAKQVAEPILEASKRIETVANGGGTPSAKKPAREYETADEVWGGMVTDAEEEDRQRAAA